MAIHLDTSILGATYSNDNLTSAMTAVSSPAIANKGVSEGKWYWEVKVDSAVSGRVVIGIGDKNVSRISYDETTSRRVYYGQNGNAWTSVGKTYGATFGTSDIIGIALDIDNGTIEFYKNGISQGVAYNDIKTMSFPIFPYATQNIAGSSVTLTFNFGSNLMYSVPSGYKPYQSGNKILLCSNEKVYSLEPIDTWYQTNMTSNNTPAPLVASASNTYSSTYPAWRAFDNLTNSLWLSANGYPKGWLQLDLGEQKVFNSVTIHPRYDVSSITEAPKDFYILGSNNGSDFTQLAFFKDVVSWKQGTPKNFDFRNKIKYRYYRIQIEANNGQNWTTICRLVFSTKQDILYEVPNLTMNNFIKYGTSSLNKLNQIITDKSYLLQNEISENSEDLRTTQLDRKPLSISFS